MPLKLTFQSLDSNSERKVVFVSHKSFLYLYLLSTTNKQTTILVSKSRERKRISVEQTQGSLDRWWFTPVVSLDTFGGEFFSERISLLTLWSKTTRSLPNNSHHYHLNDQMIMITMIIIAIFPLTWKLPFSVTGCEESLTRFRSAGGPPFVSLRLPDVLGTRDNTNRFWMTHILLNLHTFLTKPLPIPHDDFKVHCLLNCGF